MLSSSNRKTRSKGRLVRSLEFEPEPTITTSTSIAAAATTSIPKSSRKKSPSSPMKSIWRKNIIDPVGFTTHKMSSVTNNFLSSDVTDLGSSTSSIDEMVGDLVEPGRATLVFPQHDEVFRTSPLSTSSFIIENDLDDQEFFNNNDEDDVSYDKTFVPDDNRNTLGMTWNSKQNQWLPLIYRYVFPSSAFSVPKHASTSTGAPHSQQQKNVTWTLKNGHVHLNSTKETASTSASSSSSSFSFPPPQKSIMMGPHCDDKDARDVCEKLLELMDDENLMLPAVKVSPQCSSPVNSTCHPSSKAAANALNTASNQPANPSNTSSVPLKSLLSEWSSLPSSPPPPIFHDVLCNRPIPELRLSPPMSGKSICKRPTATSTNSPCESPLTKRLRFSSSSSSIA